MKKKESFHLSPKVVLIILTVLGLALIVLSDYKYKSPAGWWEKGGKGVVNSIGCTLISAALISLLLEISTIHSFIENAIKNLFTGEVTLDKYTDTELKKISKSIFYKRANIESTIPIRDTLFDFEEKLINSISEKYYDYHVNRTILTPISSKQIFKKHVETEYKLILPHKTPYSGVFYWKIFSPKYNMSEDEIKKEFSILELTVCGKKISPENMPPIQIKNVSKNEYNFYDYVVSIKLPEFKTKEYTVKTIVEYNVPYYDTSHIYKMRSVCKFFKHTMSIRPDENDKDEWELSGNAFTAFYQDQTYSSETDKYKVEQSTPDSITVNFSQWALPGFGYVIIAHKK